MFREFRQFSIAPLDTIDAESFFQLIDKNRSRLDFFAGILAQTKTLRDTIIFCNSVRKQNEAKSYFPFIIQESNSKELVGFVDFKNIFWHIPKAEVGYFIDTNFEGQGVITEALTIIIEAMNKEYGFKKLLCRANASNLGSIAVVERCGFILEGVIRNDYKTTNNEIVDLNYYGRVF